MFLCLSWKTREGSQGVFVWSAELAMEWPISVLSCGVEEMSEEKINPMCQKYLTKSD